MKIISCDLVSHGQHNDTQERSSACHTESGCREGTTGAGGHRIRSPYGSPRYGSDGLALYRCRCRCRPVFAASADWLSFYQPGPQPRGYPGLARQLHPSRGYRCPSGYHFHISTQLYSPHKQKKGTVKVTNVLTGISAKKIYWRSNGPGILRRDYSQESVRSC